jgi:D-3-phosphoglycerate dehydrogenase
MSHTVLITDPLDPIAYAMLEEQGVTVDNLLDYDEATLVEHLKEANGWIVRSGTTVTADLLDHADNLTVIGRAGVGVDNIDLDAATRKGVLVCNAPDGNTISTAEHACAMMQAMARTIPQANRSLLDGKWNRKQFAGAELHDKTLGIVGIGKVGRAVAERMQGYGMRLVAFDPLVSEDVANRYNVTLVSLDELLAESDFITIHTPLNDETRGMIAEDELATCKDSVRIVNCARGGIVDEQALLDALQAEEVAAAAVDVYSEEPPESDFLHELINHPNVVATPHIAATTGAAQEKVARQITEQVLNALDDEPVSTPVNGMAIRMAAQPEVQPFLTLADRLGQIAYQLTDERVRDLTVRCRGDVPRRFAEVLSVSALRGLLNRWADEPVNFINAPVLAEDMGLSFTETRQSDGDGRYTSLIEVAVTTDENEYTVAGTVLNGDDLRIVEINDYNLEVHPEGELLLYQNVDRPGMLATVGGILSDADVNIGALALGREERGSMALTAVSVDDPVSADVKQQIADIDGVSGVRIVRIG